MSDYTTSMYGTLAALLDNNSDQLTPAVGWLTIQCAGQEATPRLEGIELATNEGLSTFFDRGLAYLGCDCGMSGDLLYGGTSYISYYVKADSGMDFTVLTALDDDGRLRTVSGAGQVSISDMMSRFPDSDA